MVLDLEGHDFVAVHERFARSRIRIFLCQLSFVLLRLLLILLTLTEVGQLELIDSGSGRNLLLLGCFLLLEEDKILVCTRPTGLLRTLDRDVMSTVDLGEGQWLL